MFKKKITCTKDDIELDITKLRKETNRRIDKMTLAHQKACAKGRRGLANWYHSLLFYLYSIRNILDNQTIPVSPIIRYLISSLQLAEIFNYLNDGTNDEKFCYCTGIIDEKTNTIIPTKLLKPEMSVRSAGYVEGDWRSIHSILSGLDDWFHAMILQCHLHPGCGPGSTHPSSTDMRNHTDLEANYPVIGAIFVRDGYVRFFSADKEFEVEVYGKGVKKVADKLYFIENQN